MITLADGLSAGDAARAEEAGPEYVATTDGYPELLRVSGFVDTEVGDVSDEYLETMTAWIREWDEESPELVGVLGEEAFVERQTRRRHSLRLISEGLLRRHLITASRPAT